MKCEKCGREIAGSEFASHWAICTAPPVKAREPGTAEQVGRDREQRQAREAKATQEREAARKRREHEAQAKRKHEAELERARLKRAGGDSQSKRGDVTWQSVRGSGRARAGVDFEVVIPTGAGVCSDVACPCPESVIPRGMGYLFISQAVVDFRRDAPTEQDAVEKLSRMQEALENNSGATVAFVSPRCAVPVLVCEQGARRRGLDLEIAAADARHWWETGLVPLRATPQERKE